MGADRAVNGPSSGHGKDRFNISWRHTFAELSSATPHALDSQRPALDFLPSAVDPASLANGLLFRQSSMTPIDALLGPSERFHRHSCPISPGYYVNLNPKLPLPVAGDLRNCGESGVSATLLTEGKANAKEDECAAA